MGLEIKIEKQDGSKVTQQKGRHVPLQLQEAVDAEIKRLLEVGHIEWMNKMTDGNFIQLVAIKPKKDRSVKLRWIPDRSTMPF